MSSLPVGPQFLSRTDFSKLWIPELVERFASALQPNDAACTLRLVSKATAAQFRGRREFTSVRLSSPIPSHAFTRKWAAPGAMRSLTLQQRHRLLCLTAASGSIPNFQVALDYVGLIPTKQHEEKWLEAAAGAGSLEMCDWLLQRGCLVSSAALNAAARSGQQAICDLLLMHAQCSAGTVCAAARGGRLGLMEWLLQRLHQRRVQAGPGPDSSSPGVDPIDCFDSHESGELLEAAAEACDPQALQSLYRRCLGALARRGISRQDLLARYMLRGAAVSPSPDWQAKVEWVETLFSGPGYTRQWRLLVSASTAPDAPSRLTWLRQRGYVWSYDVWCEVLLGVEGFRSIPLLEYLIADGARLPTLSSQALRSGLVHLLSANARDRLTFDVNIAALAVRVAAAHAGLPLLQWAVEHLGPSVLPGEPHECMNALASAGNVEALAWLHERGCSVAWTTFLAAAEGGCEEALEWLVEHGCPMTDDGVPYQRAAYSSDLATLCCLQRVGCPWGPIGEVFNSCVYWCPLPVIRWLVEAGCPVDWEAVRRCTSGKANPFYIAPDVRAWLMEQQREHERPAA